MKNNLFYGLFFLALASCKAGDAMDATISMQDQMGTLTTTTQEMQKETQRLNQAIHLQKLDAALRTMFDAANTRDYFPPSAGLMAGAKVFAEEATAEELVEYFYVTLKEINKTKPQDFRRLPDNSFSPDYLREFNHQKHVKVTALLSIAAQVPQAVVQQMIDEQVHSGGGRYEDIAYAFLAARGAFLVDFYLTEGVLSSSQPVNNVGKLRKAFEYLSNLEFLAQQPFADKMLLTTTGIIETPDDENYVIGVDPDEVKRLWAKLVQSIDTQMPAEMKEGLSPYAREIDEIRWQAESHL